jgi:hypothetical protein
MTKLAKYICAASKPILEAVVVLIEAELPSVTSSLAPEKRGIER